MQLSVEAAQGRGNDIAGVAFGQDRGQSADGSASFVPVSMSN